MYRKYITKRNSPINISVNRFQLQTHEHSRVGLLLCQYSVIFLAKSSLFILCSVKYVIILCLAIRIQIEDILVFSSVLA